MYHIDRRYFQWWLFCEVFELYGGLGYCSVNIQSLSLFTSLMLSEVVWLCPDEGCRVLPHLLTVELAVWYFLANNTWRELALIAAWNVLLWSGLPSVLLPSPREQHALVTGPGKMGDAQSRVTQHDLRPTASSRGAPSNPQNNEWEGSASPELIVVLFHSVIAAIADWYKPLHTVALTHVSDAIISCYFQPYLKNCLK